MVHATPRHAVGVDYYVRLAQGDLVADGATEPLDPHVIADGMAIRTRYFDDFFLTATGWQPETTTAERMFAVHGRPFRLDEAVAGLLDANYTAAELVA